MAAELTLLPEVSFRGREITAPRLRGLLALLADNLRTGCSTGRLVDGLWPDVQPANPTKALQILVSRARAQLGADVIASTPTGYRLALAVDEVDAAAIQHRAAAAAEHLRADDPVAALADAEAGLALWDGTGADGPVGDPLVELRAGRIGAHRALVRSRALALSRAGRAGDAVEALTGLVRQYPRDEELLAALLRSEAATAGPAAALARYDTYRRMLRDDLGADPGAALQAVHQQLLRDEAPPVRNGVPHEPNPLLGRDADIEAVTRLLRTSRVTSIVGPGGLGKTRLAHVVSRRAEYPVVHLVALAGVTHDEDVASEVASVLGAREARRTPAGAFAACAELLPRIVDALGAYPALLVLDNCEHVLEGAAELVQALVAMTAELRILTTSRAPLGLSSESVHLLPELDEATTAELFEQRARAARAGVDLPPDAVAELCRNLDGLPLAVELAAARTRVMSVAEIAKRLDDRFALLRGGARDAPQRHRTLHAVVDWSWNLLDPAGQAALRALSICPGGFTADAARHLLGADAEFVLEDLVDQSLLKVVDTPAGARFRMLETVREFSASHREAAGETERVLGGFVAWTREFALAHRDALFGSDPAPVLERVRLEQDNLLHGLRHGLGTGDGATVAAIGALLAGLWLLDSDYPRLATLTEETAWTLSHFRPGPELVEAARAVAAVGTVCTFMLEGPRAVRPLVTLRRLPPAPPDTLPRALAAVLLAAPRVTSPDHPALQELCDSDAPLLAGLANGAAAHLWENQGDLERALACARRTLEAFAAPTAEWMQMAGHSRVGELCLQLERGAEALHHLTAAFDLLLGLGLSAEAFGLRWGIIAANMQVGAVDEAERWWGPAAEDGPRAALRVDLGARAEILLARGEVDEGLRVWRQAVEQLRNTESPAGADVLGLMPWSLENHAAAVVAHVQHSRLDLVEGIVDELPHVVSALLADPMVKPLYLADYFPICGALLLALGMAALARGDTRSGVRMVALAERFRYAKGFQPTMSSARARRAAEHADRPAYDDAVSSYAGLGRHELRAAAQAVLGARTPERH
ncbi:ATP-binding protein [Pseudonocardia nigra]|uniref:ATP-binding protein n=1 Tax=Pseudonocardia nigra TaxID=1921578 RepID=UPI001C5ED086|nr:BTAD domain-containing putative transcriptional regulator [Pseudonocardia nigra]